MSLQKEGRCLMKMDESSHKEGRSKLSKRERINYIFKLNLKSLEVFFFVKKIKEHVKDSYNIFKKIMLTPLQTFEKGK